MKKNNKKTKKEQKVKARLNKQRVFCAISIGLTIGCAIFYGTRAVSLYLDTKKDKTSDATLATTLKKDNINKNNFKNINGTYYFTSKEANNYIEYSGLSWRIVKVNSDSTVTLVSEDTLTDLAFGKNKEYDTSYINKWLNKEGETKYTGILETLLNNKDTYLTNVTTCTDVVDNPTNEACENKYTDKLIGSLDLTDYINTGADKGFTSNDQTFYLSNTNQDGEIWYVNSENKVGTSDGEDIYGLKATINLKNNIELTGGKGTEKAPYKIEKETGMLGSYVNLDGDTWRTINYDDKTVTLVLESTLSEAQPYASSGYKYDDQKYGTAAYYLNTTYLNNLSYKDIINETTYSNGYYGSDNDYNYIDTLTGKIKTKVALPTIADIMYKNDNDYATMTGVGKNANLIYIAGTSGEYYTDNSKKENNLLPVINIDRDNLTSGKGTKASPYERK